MPPFERRLGVAIDEVVNSPWTRKHDDPRQPLIRRAPKIVYPRSLEDLIEICKNRPPIQRLKAAGSHWSLSRAAISDHTFIETHDPHNNHQAMGRTLHNVIPNCLHPDLLDSFGSNPPGRRGTLTHVEAGKRVYQLYAELDQVDTLGNPKTFGGYLFKKYGNTSFTGPWGPATLGGAGGQTIVGAFNTGTHGGDFDRPPIADSVIALHLVTDGGKHYWIERVDENYYPQLTEDFKLTLEFGRNEFGGVENFEQIRDNDVLDAVIVSAGRFGIIYSVVLRAVPQYNLYERRRLHIWQDFKHQVKDLNVLFTRTRPFPPARSTFPPPRYRGIAASYRSPYH
jgi:hypothetical protein